MPTDSNKVGAATGCLAGSGYGVRSAPRGPALETTREITRRTIALACR